MKVFFFFFFIRCFFLLNFPSKFWCERSSIHSLIFHSRFLRVELIIINLLYVDEAYLESFNFTCCVIFLFRDIWNIRDFSSFLFSSSSSLFRFHTKFNHLVIRIGFIVFIPFNSQQLALLRETIRSKF